MNRHSKAYLENLTPAQGFDLLVEGNQRFVKDLRANSNSQELVQLTKEGQFPFAVVLSCMDSRTSVELIFDQNIGDLFSIRIAGNIVNNDIVGSIEYATKYVGSKLVVVLGHTKCGAVNGAKAGVQDGNITGLLDLIKPAIAKADANAADYRFGDNVAYANVEHSIEEILSRSTTVKELFEAGQIGIVGGIYNVETGEVDFFKHYTKAGEAEQQLANAN